MIIIKRVQIYDGLEWAENTLSFRHLPEPFEKTLIRQHGRYATEQDRAGERGGLVGVSD